MSAKIWAHVTDGTCDNIIMLDPATSDGYPMAGLVEIDGLSPMPGIGWRYADGEWTAPPTPALTADPPRVDDLVTTSTVTYQWAGWPEDEPPASVDFAVDDGAPETVALDSDNKASIAVSATDPDVVQIQVTCAGLYTSVAVEAA